MAAPKRARVSDQIVNFQPDGRVVRSDDGARAHADDHVQWDPVANQCSKHADVGGAAQATGAQHEAHANMLGTVFHDRFATSYFGLEPQPQTTCGWRTGRS